MYKIMPWIRSERGHHGGRKDGRVLVFIKCSTSIILILHGRKSTGLEVWLNGFQNGIEVIVIVS